MYKKEQDIKKQVGRLLEWNFDKVIRMKTTYCFKLSGQKQNLKVQQRLLICIEVCFT